MAKGRGLGKIGEIGEIGPLRERKKIPIGEALPGDAPRTQNLLSEEMRALEARIGTYWARQIAALQARGILGSVPELMVYSWLEGRSIPFEFQSAMYGGRGIKGGQVLDFILKHLPELMVWRVMGDYWHTRPGTPEQDRLERVMLLGANIGGESVSAVVDLWESDIYDRMETTMRAAMAGREVGAGK